MEYVIESHGRWSERAQCGSMSNDHGIHDETVAGRGRFSVQRRPFDGGPARFAGSDPAVTYGELLGLHFHESVWPAGCGGVVAQADLHIAEDELFGRNAERLLVNEDQH